jgi:hypothetical protein
LDKKRGKEKITLRNRLGTNSTDKSNEIHQDLRDIWVGREVGCLVGGGRRRVEQEMRCGWAG